MKVIATKLNGIKILKPILHEDKRGFFYEAFNQNKLRKIIKKNFVIRQANVSFSKKNVFRGFHYQISPYEQAKIVRVLNGEILDIVICLDKKSKNYLKEYSIKLSSKNKKIIFIPSNFAHGFLVLSKTAIIEYFTSSKYSKKHERTMHFSKSKINYILKKFTNKMIISDKDNQQ